MKTLRKIIFRFLILPIIAFLVLVVAAAALLYFQQERVVKLAVGELNKRLPGELVIGGSNISIFQNFPYVSIALKNVRFYAAKQPGSSQSLFEAEKIYAGFSLPDILKQHYRVKVISLKNGHLSLVEGADGRLNIVEAARMNADTATGASDSSAALNLALKKIVLRNLDISFLDKASGQQVACHIDKIQSAFHDDSLHIYSSLQGNLMADFTRPGDTTLFRHKHLSADIRLSYQKATQLLKLQTGKLKLEDAGFDVSGTVDLLHGNTVDLRFSGDKPDFHQLFSFAPESLAKELKHFRYDGILDFSGTMKGKWQGDKLPRIELSFACRNAWLHNTDTQTKLDSLAFKGYYTNGADQSLKTSELRLLDMSARPGKGIFRANLVLRDFTDPKISMKVNSDLELRFIGNFLGIPDLQRITGHIRLDMNFQELVDISLPEQTIRKLTKGLQSELTVTDLSFRIPSSPYLVEHLDLHASMKDGFVKMDTLDFRVGHSDFHLNGSLSDLPALFHKQQKPLALTLHAASNQLVLKELLAFDTALSRKSREEIHGFNIGLSLQTSVDELSHPNPLPRGRFSIEHLSAAFKRYPHSFHDFGAELAIGDTSLVLRNFAGRVDSSDVRLSGRVNNYNLWFAKVKRGRTQIAFDLKSQRLALNEILGRRSRRYFPKQYAREVLNNVWVRSKTDLRYDSVFRFANIRIANISGTLTKHPYRLDSLRGNIKFSNDHFVRIDTLQGRIGNSDINLSMRLYTGQDTIKRNKENYLQFTSRFLDVNQLTSYVENAQDEMANPAKGPAADPAPVQDSTDNSLIAAASTDSFNLFRIPFIHFNASVNIGRIKCRRLGLKNLSTKLRMLDNQQLYLDTFGVEVAGGRIGARAHFNGSNPDRIYLRSRLNVNNVDLEKLMLKLDYLGQDYVINKNIRGRLSGQVKCYLLVHPDLMPIMDKSEAQIDVNIYDGELDNFAPLQALSTYFSDKNLNKVRFDTLRNQLSFKNNTLSIPAMNINSSIGFLEVSGSQGMDEHMEYYLRIPLKLVTHVAFQKLFGKKQEEVDPDQVDAIQYRDANKKVRFINLKIVGTPDDYKMGLGKAK